MPLEPSWRERGCDYFFETTYLLTRKDSPVCDAAPGAADELILIVNF